MTKVSNLPTVVPVGTDVLYVVDDPGGTPVPTKATIEAIHQASGVDAQFDTVTVANDLTLTAGDMNVSTNWDITDGTNTITFNGSVLTFDGDQFGINATTGDIITESTLTTGLYFTSQGSLNIKANADAGLRVNRVSDDGGLVLFYQDGVFVGNISVSGTTVSYNAFTGSHVGQWETPGPSPLRGTVLETVDEMSEWEFAPNEKHPKIKVSDKVKSSCVYGVYAADVLEGGFADGNTAYINAVGTGLIRIAKNFNVKNGDLLVSNGDGCAAPQKDDLVRSSTIAQVKSSNKITEYKDGSYLVACQFMRG